MGGTKSQLFIAGVILLYMTLSVAVTLMNKAAFPRNTFPYPFTISCFQMIVALLWLYLITLIQRVKPTWLEVIGIQATPLLQWDLKSFLSSSGAAGAFMGMLSMGNVCLMFVQVSFYQVLQHFSLILGRVSDVHSSRLPNRNTFCAGLSPPPLPPPLSTGLD